MQMLYFKFQHLYHEGGLGTITDYTDFFDLKSIRENRAIACLLGLGIADALGASTEFIPFERDRKTLIEKDFKEIPEKVKAKELKHRG
jgi:hypothetical protein